MAVQTPQLDAPVYQPAQMAQPPVVQEPPISATEPSQVLPPQAGFVSKAGAAAYVANGILNGWIRGRQAAQQKNIQKEQSTIQFWNNTVQQKVDLAKTLRETNPDSKEYADAYNDMMAAWRQSLQAQQKYVMPDDQGKKKTKGQKFEGVLGQVFGQSGLQPHDIPGAALKALATGPPPGFTESLQDQAAKMQYQQTQLGLQEAQRISAAQKVYDKYSGLSEDELANRPEAEQHAFRSAKNALYPEPLGTRHQYVSADGSQRGYYYDGYQPSGWQPTTGAPAQPRVGTEGEFTAQALKQYGFTQQNAPAPLLKYLHDAYSYKSAQETQSTVIPAHLDATGAWVPSSSSTTRGAAAPTAPQGFPSVEEMEQRRQSGGASPTQGQRTGTLNPYPNPEDRPPQESFTFNQAWAKPGPYLTTLSPADEAEFQKWAKANPKAVEGELDNPQADYDVRGHWLAAKKGDPSAKLVLNKWDGKLHGSDKWKTPYNGSFSRESIYATPDAPTWKGNRLVAKDGQVVTDETPTKTKGGTPASTPRAMAPTPSQPGPDGRTTWQQSQNTQRVETEKTAKYTAAQNKYDAEMARVRALYKGNSTTTEAQGEAYQDAQGKAEQKAYDQLMQDHAEIEKWYAQQVHAVGGHVPGDMKPPPGQQVQRFGPAQPQPGMKKYRVSGGGQTYEGYMLPDDATAYTQAGGQVTEIQ